jgi:hypothetical protein
MSRIIGCFGVLALVLALTTDARAEDWSAFIDNTPQKPLTKVAGPSKQAPAPRPAARAVAKPTKVAKVNARAKTKKHR